MTNQPLGKKIRMANLSTDEIKRKSYIKGFNKALDFAMKLINDCQFKGEIDVNPYFIIEKLREMKLNKKWRLI